jgi:hypothetical protein
MLLICLGAVAGDNSWQNPYEQIKIKDKYTIIVEHKNAYGEKELANRIKIAGQRLGWLIYITETIANEDGNKLLNQVRPDFVLCLSAQQIKTEKPFEFKHYLTFFQGMRTLFNRHWLTGNSSIKDHIKELSNLDGFTFISPDDDFAPLKDYLSAHGKKLHMTQFLPTVQKFDLDFSKKSYHDPRIYFSGILWDRLRKNSKYKKIYNLLSKQDYIDFYGPSSSWLNMNVNYLGEMPNDGESYLNKISSYQVALILHSNRHLQFGLPSSRVFEAAAVGNIIISDNIKFIKDNFGDFAFYIDETKSAEKIFKQIDGYMKWIKDNPDKAKSMAEKSHQIFLDKFTLEHNLIDLAKMHESILLGK